MAPSSLPKSGDPAGSEAVARGILRRHARRMIRAIVTPEFFRMHAEFIAVQARMHLVLRREAARKKPSRWYVQFCEELLENAATQELGRIAGAPEQDLVTLDQVLNAVERGLLGKSAVGKIAPAAFVSLNKRLLVPPGKRGPKRRELNDRAYARNIKGEPVSSIAQDLDPIGYQNDSFRSMNRFTKALRVGRSR